MPACGHNAGERIFRVLVVMKILDELKLRVRAACGAGGMAEYFHILLMEGALKTVVAMVEARPELLAELLPIVANPEASMNVRFGASAVFERNAGTAALAALVAPLGELAGHADPRVRADACHYLGLSGRAEARDYLRPRLNDDSAEVREITADSLAELDETAK
jgi:HEAT repeat protein